MLKTTSMIILLSSLGLALPAAAGAGQDYGAEPYGHGFMMMDENEDQVITHEEFENRQSERFKQADENGDGTVTSGEFSKFLEYERERRRQMREQYMFNRLDSDGDGVISSEETSAHAKQMFERMDSNGDGKIDAADRAMKRDWKHKGRDGKAVTQ